MSDPGREVDSAPESPRLRSRKGNAFPKSLRVVRKGDFDAAFATGARASCRAFLVLARANGLGLARIGISTGRRFGAAHRRNRAKRLLREAFRLNYGAFPAGFDFVVVPRGDGFPDELKQVLELLAEAARRASQARPSAKPERKGRPGP